MARAPAPGTQSGTLLVSWPRIGGEFLHSSPFNGFTSDNWGLADPLIFADSAPVPQRGNFNPAISLVTGWEVAQDASSITFKVRRGVQFHQGFGEMTAHDIAWSFNDALREGNTNPRSGFVGEWMGLWEVIDDYTVKLNIRPGAGLSPVWLLEMSNVWRTTLTVTSQKAAEQFGPGSFNVVGTGPFEMIDAKEDSFVKLRALTDNYRVVPNVEEVTLKVIPETATRVAAFKVGELDITDIPAAFIQDAVDSRGGRVQQLGEGQTLHIYFGGNFWQKNDPITDESLFPRDGLKADADHPWISDPDDPVSMARGDKFRRALAMAVDRDLLNEVVGKGLTPPVYTFTGFTESDPVWKDSWFIPFDPEQSKRDLADLGIPEGFEVPLWLAPDATALPPEFPEAVAQMWTNIGLKVTVEKTAYNGRRPTLIGRSIDVPFHHHMNLGYLDEPKGRLVSAAKGGANRGIELPNEILSKTYWANLSESNPAKRIENNVLLQDYFTARMLSVPMVRQSALIAVSPRVTEWQPYTETFGNINSFDTVVLAK